MKAAARAWGKTTLACRVAAYVGSRLVRLNGPQLGDTAAMLRLLTTLRVGDVLFLDEIHAIPREALEVLYQAMEERRLSLMIHQGARERALELELPAFTLLAATTEEDEVSDALKSRFTIQQHLDIYAEEDLARMACTQAEARGLRLEPEAALDLAACARGVPRLVKELAGSACRAAQHAA